MHYTHSNINIKSDDNDNNYNNTLDTKLSTIPLNMNSTIKNYNTRRDSSG